MNRREAIVGGLCLPLSTNSFREIVTMSEAVPNAGSGESFAAGFSGALLSDGPSGELKAAEDAFNWLIGGWTGTLRDIDADGSVRMGEVEWWFSWVLEGRAIQDVFISPPRSRRKQDSGEVSTKTCNRFGTTLRWFDRKTQKWRIVWINPVRGAMNTLTGERNGDQIVLNGTNEGKSMRWIFCDIRADSFTWRGEEEVEGRWRLSSEFKFRRIV
jgi:hypothetical protein